jgi:serine-type D-Ala-D-Ala carboxypeptidase (penicillin-binding protein 5/6)
VTVARGTAADIKTVIDVESRLFAPLATDAIVGQLRVIAGGETVATVPVHPLVNVAAGSWWRRLIDTVRLWFR